MPKGRGAKPKRGYRHVTKEERLKMAEERAIGARVAVALADVDLAKLAALLDSDDDGRGRQAAEEQAAERKAVAVRAAESAASVADKLRGKPLSRSGKSKQTKVVNERVRAQLTELVHRWETARFEHEMMLAELDAIPAGDRDEQWEDEHEEQERGMRLYDAAVEAAEERLPAATAAAEKS